MRSATAVAVIMTLAGQSVAQVHSGLPNVGPKFVSSPEYVRAATLADAPNGVRLLQSSKPMDVTLATDEVSRDRDVMIYDNTRGNGFFWFTGAPPTVSGTNAIMDASLAIPNSDGSFDIDRLSWGVGPTNSEGGIMSIDFAFSFYDKPDLSFDSSTPVGNPDDFMFGFTIGTFDLDPQYAYTFGTVFGDTFHMNDRGMYIEMALIDHNTGEVLAPGNWAFVFQDTFDANAWVPTIAVGQSDPMQWSDNNNDGTITSDENFEFIGSRAALLFNVGSPTNRWCPADFNRDGFSDFFDFNDFVDAFENGC